MPHNHPEGCIAVSVGKSKPNNRAGAGEWHHPFHHDDQGKTRIEAPVTPQPRLPRPSEIVDTRRVLREDYPEILSTPATFSA